MVRLKIHTPYLRIKETIVGRQSRTNVAVIYIENLTNANIVKEVFERLDALTWTLSWLLVILKNLLWIKEISFSTGIKYGTGR